MTNLPWALKPQLSQDRLVVLAEQFREIYYAVESLLTTEDDCNFCRGTLFFGRARQRMINLALSGRYPWLDLLNSAMDVTLTIDGLPFRFFRDDFEMPKKRGFWRRNGADRLFSPVGDEPVIFRFIVQRPYSDQEELEIYFVGYNEVQELVCEWKYGSVAAPFGLGDPLPQAVEQHPAPVQILDDSRESAG